MSEAPFQNLLYISTNPVRENVCPGCEIFIGKIFAPGAEPPLPAHPGCYCIYVPTWDGPSPFAWSDVVGEARTIWIRHAAYILRNGWTLPLILIPLTLEAERYNEEHTDEEELTAARHSREGGNPSRPLEDHMTAQDRLFTGRILAGPVATAASDVDDSSGAISNHSYQCLFMGAGRVRHACGDDSDWLIPAQILHNAAHLFESVPSFIDHPQLFGFGWRQEPSLRDLAGIAHGCAWDEDEQGVTGTLTLYDNEAGSLIAALYDQILRDRSKTRPVPEIGLSAVIWHNTHLDEETGLRITDEIQKVDSVDHVYSAGARGYVRAALAAQGWTPDASRSFYIPSHIGATTGPTSQEVSAMSEALNTPGAQEGTQSPEHVMVSASAPPPNHTQGIDSPGVSHNHTVVTPTAPPAAAAVTTASHPREGGDPLLEALARMETRLDDIELQQLQAAEAGTIQGMGAPPRASVRTMLVPMEQVTLATEAMLAGVRPPTNVRPLTGIRELYHLLSGDYQMTGIYQPENVYLANVTSSTMAQLVANVLNKRVMIAFQSYPRWWEAIATQEDFNSLQQVRWITLGGVGELPTVNAGAAYTELTWDDLAQRDDFLKKGGFLGLTIEAIDKDDTRKIQLAPRALAQSAWLTLSKSISAIFTANTGTGPSIYYDDSNTRVLFHASHSNLGTTALSPAAWETTRIAMRKQAEHHSGERLGALVVPKFCLVPPDLEFAAIQALATAHIPGSANYNINPEAAGDTREARLAAARERVIVVDLWTDTDNWAAVADPILYPSIGLAFRFGRVPEIFSVADPRAGLMFTNDVMPVKVRFFYAAGPIDYRGLYKHNVS